MQSIALRALHKRKPQEMQGIALRVMRALHKRKPQATQAFDWLLRWLAVSIDHSYWLALACIAFEWKPVLRNVFACVILLRFLRTFLTQSIALRAWIETGLKAFFTNPVLLSSSEVLVLEDNQGPIYKSLTLSSDFTSATRRPCPRALSPCCRTLSPWQQH